jgi:hypothetical protein
MFDTVERKHSNSIFLKGVRDMKLFTNWKTALVTLVIFGFSMIVLPGLTASAMAADTAAPSNAGAGAAGTDTTGATAGAEGAGAAGGDAVFAGLSAGTLAIGAVIVASGIAIAILSSESSSSTSHH